MEHRDVVTKGLNSLEEQAEEFKERTSGALCGILLSEGDLDG